MSEQTPHADQKSDAEELAAIFNCMTGREIAAMFEEARLANERGEDGVVPEIYRKRLSDKRAAEEQVAELKLHVRKFGTRIETVEQKITDFFPQVKDRILAAFHRTAAELDQVPASLYAQKQGVALGLLAALRACDLIDPAEYQDLALQAHYVP